MHKKKIGFKKVEKIFKLKIFTERTLCNDFSKSYRKFISENVKNNVSTNIIFFR